MVIDFAGDGYDEPPNPWGGCGSSSSPFAPSLVRVIAATEREYEAMRDQG